MSEKKRVTLDLSEDAERNIRASLKMLPVSESEKLIAALSLAQAIIKLEDREEPAVVIFGRLQITNDRYREEREQVLKEAIQEVEKQDKKLAETLYEAMQLKPTFFGMGVDLKPLFERMRKLFNNKVTSK